MNDNHSKDILRLALPIVATNILSRGPAIVDTAFIGHIGPAQLASVGLAQLFVFAMQAFTHATAVAGTVMVAFRTGEKDFVKRREEADTDFSIAIMIGILLSFIGYNFSGAMGDAMGVEGAVHKHLLEYTDIFFFFFTLKLLNFFLASIFQGSGDSRTPLAVIGSINIMNIFLDYSLIFGKFGLPRMEVEGAALATGIAESTGAIVLYIIAIKRGLLSPRLALPKMEPAKKLARLGLPVLGERLVGITMQFVFARMVIAISVIAYGAHQMGINIEMVSLLSGFAFMQATTALVGQNLGARDPDRARIMAKKASYITVGIMMVFAIILISFPEFWVRIFTDDPEVIKYGKRFLIYGCIAQPLLGISMVYAGALRGAGETKYVMWVSMLGSWATRIPIAYLLGFVFNFGLDGLWATMPMDWIVRLSFYYRRFTRGPLDPEKAN
ncbi:MAG: MATE family efflux transporter [candidate division Zixibacteria bacterium]|nr:MATE family efflux transporter [candidate division Zixibacteria bacterium]